MKEGRVWHIYLRRGVIFLHNLKTLPVSEQWGLCSSQRAKSHEEMNCPSYASNREGRISSGRAICVSKRRLKESVTQQVGRIGLACR